MQHCRPTLIFKPLIPLLPILSLLPLPSHHCLLLLAVLLRLLFPLVDFLRVLQWNAGGLRDSSTELLHFLSFHPVDFICIQESNLHSSSSFQIPGFSTLRSDRTHSLSGILSHDVMHASKAYPSLNFLPPLSLLDPYSDCVGVNISLSNSSSLSFLNVYAPPVRSSQTDGRTDSFSPSILLSSRNCHSGGLQLHHALWDSKGISDSRGEEVFD